MKKIQILCILAIILAISYSQTVDLTTIFKPETIATLGPEYNDPEFIKIIDNYFGCRTWENGQCTQCSQGYLFNNKGICCKVDQNCLQFNRDAGICQECYNGFQVTSNGTCAVQAISTSPDSIGCAVWQRNRCTQCSVRYFNSSGVCRPVDDNCRDWAVDGTCTACYPGYEVNNGACALVTVNPSAAAQNANPLCKKWTNDVCEDCADKTYRNNAGVCTQVDNNCNTYDRLDGLCLSCYLGYDLINGSCVYSPSNTALPTDAGCRTWRNSICQECSNLWVFDANRVCIPVNSLCKTNDNNGACTTCFTGYDLVDGNCVYSPSNTAPPTDGGCKTFDLDTKKCSECSNRWVADANGLCVPVSADCRQNLPSGVCSSCYRGYDLVDGVCTYSPSNTSPLSDAGCQIWNYTANACQQCSTRWYKAETGCRPVEDICQTANEQGVCVSCYPGYDLVNDVCVFSPSNTQGPSDVGCRAWTNGVCSECSPRWVFNPSNVCTPVDGLCRTNQGSACTTCYAGYDLANGACVYSPSNTQGPSDVGCKAWNNGVCSECSPRWAFNANNVCTPVDGLCQTNSGLACASCYPGYDLVDGACVYSPSNTQGPTDPGCKAWTNGVCSECSPKWVLDANNVCNRVKDDCRTNEANGRCSGCYLGYDLVDGACVYSPSNTAPVSDVGCQLWNYANNTCLQCSNKWVSVNGVCQPVSALCRSNDDSGSCLTCFIGYDLLDGNCVFSPSNLVGPADKGCKAWQNGICVTCSNGFAFNADKTCIQVSDLCKTSQGLACTSCYRGYILADGACSLPAVIAGPTDSGCSKWNWDDQICLECGPYWFLANGKCNAVSDLCKTYSPQNGLCLTCYKGYNLNNGVCELAPNQTPRDPGCSSWNWDEQICLACSQGYVNVDGVCQAVSPFCKSNDPSSPRCTSCFQGYALNSANGACQVAQTLCRTSNDSGCATCYNGFVLYRNNCVPLSAIADIALYYAECCPQKLEALRAEGRIPK